MSKIILMIFGMGLVTYIPRALPLVALSGMKLPPLAKRFLENIPYAALGALIFPGILSSTGDLRLSIIGGICALIMAYWELNLVLVVAGSIGVVYLVQVVL